MSAIVYFFYRYFLAPLAYLLFQILRPLLRGKLREMTEDKNAQFFQLNDSLSIQEISLRRPLWIHAASGEIEYARPILRSLKERYPQIPLLVTFSSPSAKKILSNIPEIDVWAVIPWDRPQDVNQFLETWNPRLLMFSRTDVWPTLATVAHKKEIPMLLFSATFAENSSRLFGFTGLLTQYTLNLLNQIHCVSDDDIQSLKNMRLNTPLFASGDTRFDQVFHRLENPKPLKNLLIPAPEDFVFISGSTWAQDEEVIIPALAKLKSEGIRFIIAPHETDEAHILALRQSLAAHGLSSICYSETDHWASEVLIIDQVGILAEIYTWADAAFVGGSFKKQVHSVMEPLAAGLPVIVGPHHKNNREALYFQKKHLPLGFVVQVANNTHDIQILITRMKIRQSQMTSLKEEIRAEVEQNKHSTQRILHSIDGLLNNSGRSV